VLEKERKKRKEKKKKKLKKGSVIALQESIIQKVHLMNLGA